MSLNETRLPAVTERWTCGNEKMLTDSGWYCSYRSSMDLHQAILDKKKKITMSGYWRDVESFSSSAARPNVVIKVLVKVDLPARYPDKQKEQSH